MRYLDHELDDVLERAYVGLLRGGALAARPIGPDLASLARLEPMPPFCSSR
jgi:hypothetical protein